MNAELPPGWSKSTIQSLVGGSGLVSDGDWIESKDQDPSGDVRLIQLADIGEGVFLDRSRRFLTNETSHRLRCTRLAEGDVLIARMPDPLGRACIFPGDEKASVTAVDVLIVRPCENGVLPTWIMHAVNAPITRKTIALQASGTTRQRVSGGNLKKLELPVPPLNEQRRIVAKIEALMARSARAKKALDAIPALLDRYRQSVLAAAFRGDLTADWRAHNLGSSANISECWKLSVVSDVAELVSGQTPKGVAEQLSAEGEVPWFKVADMNHAANQREMVEFNSFLTKAQAKQLGLKIRPQGTVIFPKRGGAIATNKKRVLGCPAAFDLNIMGLIPKAVTSEFLWCWLLTVDLSKISDGSNVPQINNGDIAPLPIRVPSEEEQHEICRLLADVFASIETVEGAWKAASGHLPKLNQSVLAKAFRGELVPQDPNDEPASELLARIKAGRATPGTPNRRGGRRKRAAAPVA